MRIRRVIFFVASRRRHTRCYRDWSSDVCSSDLHELVAAGALGVDLVVVHSGSHGGDGEIGRASGRERGEISVGAGSLKKKKKKKNNNTPHPTNTSRAPKSAACTVLT